MLMLFSCRSEAQLYETICTNEFNIRDSVYDKYNLIRTDQSGNIIWATVINGDTKPFDMSQETYISCGFTAIKNGYIINNPHDYDYWLVRITNDIEVFTYPNPASCEINIMLNSFTNELNFYLLDINLKLVELRKLTNIVTPITLPRLANGIYIYNIISNNKLIKTGKICIIQNGY